MCDSTSKGRGNLTAAGATAVISPADDAAEDLARYPFNLSLSTANSAPHFGQENLDNPWGTLSNAPQQAHGSWVLPESIPLGRGNALRLRGSSSGGRAWGVSQSGQINSVRPGSTSRVSSHPAQRTSMVGGGKGGCGGCEAKVAMDLRGKGRGWVRLVTNYMESSRRRKCWEWEWHFVARSLQQKGKVLRLVTKFVARPLQLLHRS
jgi:hypothetical protein